jgi:hypothetical protein
MRPSIEIPVNGKSPLEIMGYAAHWCAGYFHVAPENIAIDVKRARLVMYDRRHDDPEAQVVRVLRASRTNSGLWFDADADGNKTGIVEIPATAD